jgi:hypothetical protein
MRRRFTISAMISAMTSAMICAFAAVAVLAPPASTAQAQELFAYPTKGQSQQQQEQDEFACYNWAKQQSGFDPMAVPTATAPPPKDKSTGPGALGGAAIGAGAGAIGGAIVGGKAGTGALLGGGLGGILGGLTSQGQHEKNKKKRDDWERQQTAQYAQQRGNYNRAYAACMSGRGYSVS